MASLQDVLNGLSGDNFKTSGMLTKILQTGVPIEEDDQDFILTASSENQLD